MSLKQFHEDLRNMPDQLYQRAKYTPRPSFEGIPSCGCPAYELAARNGKFLEDTDDVFKELEKRYDIDGGDIMEFADMFDKVSADNHTQQHGDGFAPTHGTLKDIKMATRELEKGWIA